MNTLRMILLMGLLFLNPVNKVFSQTIINDSCVVLGPTEIRVLTKMTEDLKYTKQELQICDSIQIKKDRIINSQKLMITEKDKIIKREKRKSKGIKAIIGGVSFVVGLIIGGLSF